MKLNVSNWLNHLVVINDFGVIPKYDVVVHTLYFNGEFNVFQFAIEIVKVVTFIYPDVGVIDADPPKGGAEVAKLYSSDLIARELVVS